MTDTEKRAHDLAVAYVSYEFDCDLINQKNDDNGINALDKLTFFEYYEDAYSTFVEQLSSD